MPSESVKSDRRWKETLQTVCAVMVMLTFFLLCRPGFLDSGDGGLGKLWPFGHAATEVEFYRDDSELSDDFSHDSSDDEHQWDFAEIPAMPSFVDLRNSVKVLEAARKKLAESTSNGDAQTIVAARTEYDQAIQQVRSDVARLRTLVLPGDFAYVSEDLLRLCEENG